MLAIFFLNLLLLSNGQQCQCGQLLSQQDCLSLGCEWKSTYCVQKSTRLLDGTILKVLFKYCDLFQKDVECLNQPMCVWRNEREDKCQFFTGCTAYNYTTNAQCSKISLRCFSDGIHCVEFGKCSEYKNQKACTQFKNQAYKQSQICAWIDAVQICQDPTTCDQIQLPENEQYTDERCREVLDFCSYKEGGGCTESGINCTDQKSREACKWNRAKTQRCAWVDKCVDRICSNAPANYNYKEQVCNDFTETKECSLNPKGGCVKKVTCSAILVEEGCTYDIQHRPCKWLNNVCLDLVCKNALSTLTTNKQCNEFLSGCITNGNGCVDNGECEVAIVMQACAKNKKGQDCFWDNKCLLKTCDNAPKTLITYNDCLDFSQDCTLKTGGGCTIKTCDNAPLEFTTNYDCDNYLSNCITKYGGGCMQNLKCTDITFQGACEQGNNGNLCFWDYYVCKDLICTNAPEYFNTHQLCQQFKNTCTVNSEYNGCVEYTCQNSLTQETCKSDYEKKPCTYETKCQEIACSRASKTFIDHDSCQNYDSSCTVNNSGFGCMTIPLICSALTIENACFLRKVQNGYSKCGWNGQSCQDLTCSTIPKNIKLTMDCDNYLPGCVASNPVDGEIQGCMDLPKKCSERLTYDNCKIIQGEIKCVWDILNTKCLEQNCESAIIDGVNVISDQNCNKYCIEQLTSIDCITSGCTSNDYGDGCMELKNNCFEYHTSGNCKRTKNNKCYWDEGDSQCYYLECDRIYKIGLDHDLCQGYSTQCTINSIGDRCQDLTDCSQYTTMLQCNLDKNQKICTWDKKNSYCRNLECTDFFYDTSDQQCSRDNQNCTVNAKSINGCTVRKQCKDYIYEEQCIKDLDDLDCFWANSQCYKPSEFQCSSISSNGYTTGDCEGVNFKCRANDTNTGCIEKACQDYIYNPDPDRTPITTIEQCQSFDITCTYHKQGHCQVRFRLCSDYTDEYSCTESRDEKKCFYNRYEGTCQSAKQDCSKLQVNNYGECEQLRPFCQNNGPYYCINKSCNSKQGSNISYQDCQDYDQTCSTTISKTQCYDIQQYCSWLNLDQCVRSQQGWCYVDSGTCQDFSPDRCDLIQNSNLSESECQLYHPNCILNNNGLACQNIQEQCEFYDNASCAHSRFFECVFDNPDYQQQNCINVQPNQQCDKIYLGYNNYTHLKCNKKNSNCTNNGNSGCTNKTCQNALSSTSFKECKNWLDTCTFNLINNCVTMSQYCNLQSSQQCYQSAEGECTVINDKCVKKTCDTAPITNNFSNHLQCTQYLSTCTTVAQGGCVNKQPNCEQYQSQIQCVKDLSGQRCYWSASKSACLILTCENIDSTVIYNNHSQCEDTLSSCTVKSNSYGCQNKASCNSYQTENQCFVDNQGKQCDWFTNLEGRQYCVDKSCNSAPLFFYSYQQCQSYVDNYQCTVKVINSEIKGCQQLQVCENYQYIQECLIDLNGKECIWYGFCQTKSCETADNNFYTTYQCQNYFPNCILSNKGSGCMDVQEQCAFHYNSENCIKDIQGNLCIWNEQYSYCEQRTCQNAPYTIQSDSACRNYLQGCMMNDTKCQEQVCEDFYYKTESECQKAMNGCTTDGRRCVQRGLSCELILTEIGCTYDANKNQCSWVTNTQYPHCTLKTCNTAPKEYESEEVCQQYLVGCTTNKGGGCALKTTCSAATVKTACNIDRDGQNCAWDDDKQLCRNIKCSDFFGSTYKVCISKGQNCTVGYNGKCTSMQICSDIKLDRACVKGLDGPCIWVFDYKNSDKTYGACFLYDSCKSFKWKTHKECSRISDECTTDGNQCVAITGCSETTSQLSCYKGYDGVCAWKQDLNQCVIFDNCSTFKYITHEDCQNANKQCTTNGINSCIVRSTCSSYLNQENCKINLEGVQKDNKTQEGQNISNNTQIISTGNCIWSDNNTCRNEDCSDILGRSHEQCNQIMISCTYDGEKCMKIDVCRTYDKQQKCENAKYLNGQSCQWNGYNCEDIVCVHIPNGDAMTTCQNVSTNCISNGSFCIAKSKCVDYPTKVACESGFGGTDSKYCTFINNKCQRNYCYENWISSNSNTCPIYIEKEQIFCQLEEKECKQFDPDKLLNQTDCLAKTSQIYTYSSSAKKCIKCSSVTITEQPTTVSSFVEYLMINFIVYFIF